MVWFAFKCAHVQTFLKRDRGFIYLNHAARHGWICCSCSASYSVAMYEKTYHDRLETRLSIFFHRYSSSFFRLFSRARAPTLEQSQQESRKVEAICSPHICSSNKCVYGLATNMRKKEERIFWFCLLDDLCFFSFYFSTPFFVVFVSYRLNQRYQEIFVIVYTHQMMVAMATFILRPKEKNHLAKIRHFC